jgi:hypothetical protein
MKYDYTIKAIQVACRPVIRGEYVYNIMDGALYRVNAWDVSHGYYIGWEFLRNI